MEGFGLEDLAESEMAQPQQQQAPPGAPYVPAPMPVHSAIVHSDGKWKFFVFGAIAAGALMYFFLRKKR